MPVEFQQSIFNSIHAKHHCYKDGLQYKENDCRKDSLRFLYLKSEIKEDQYFHFNMLAQMTFYKCISKESLSNIVTVLYSIIISILDKMFWHMNPFSNKTGMESVVNVKKTLITAWSRMSSNFYPIGERISVNSANKKFDCQSPLQCHFSLCFNLGMKLSTVSTPRHFQKNVLTGLGCPFFLGWIAYQSFLFWMDWQNWDKIFFALIATTRIWKNYFQNYLSKNAILVMWLICIMEYIGLFLLGRVFFELYFWSWITWLYQKQLLFWRIGCNCLQRNLKDIEDYKNGKKLLSLSILAILTRWLNWTVGDHVASGNWVEAFFGIS